MNEVLLGSVIEKVDANERKMEDQERVISELKEKVAHMPDTALLNNIKTGFEKIQTEINKISFPEIEMRELSERLLTSVMLLKQPVKQEVIQRHHVPKIIWIAASLFLLLCLVLTGWYNTNNHLKLYKANDTKYRYLKLQGSSTLNNVLGFTDNLYKVDDKMRDKVIEQEEQNQRDLEKMRRALQMEKEAKELKKQVQSNSKKEK